MSNSGVGLDSECVQAFNDLKLKKEKLKYIIYKLSDDYKEIVVEHKEPLADGQEEQELWQSFTEKLVTAQSTTKNGKVGPGPRYAVYDFQYDLGSGEGVRNKLAFLAWSPDEAAIQPKMVYASSKETLKRALSGVGAEIQANDSDELEYDTVINNLRRGKA